MRLVVEDHDVTDTDGDLATHMHTTHHFIHNVVATATTDELDLMHADDHDDLRRGLADGPQGRG